MQNITVTTLWLVFSRVLTFGFIFFRLILGRFGFKTILFIGTESSTH